MELSPTYQKIEDLTQRSSALSAHLDLEEKQGRLEEVLLEMENPDIWSNPDEAQALGQEKSKLELICQTFARANSILEDAKELLEMAQSENDKDTVNSVIEDLNTVELSIEKLEFERMFSGELDANSAYLDIQSGSGGTEAQDWAEMILRMYLRWGEKHKFKVKLMEVSAGEVAGIKSATIHFNGEYAFGWLRSEIGIHRLVENHLLMQMENATLPSHLYLYRLKSMIILKLTSIHQIYVLTLTAQVVLAVSTSTKRSLLCVLPTCPPIPWCNVKMVVRNTRIKTKP